MHDRGLAKVAPVANKSTEKRVKWYEHVKERDEWQVLRRMVDATVPRKRRRGRLESRWTNVCKRDMESMRRRPCRTGQSGRMIFNAIPSIPDNGYSGHELLL